MIVYRYYRFSHLRKPQVSQPNFQDTLHLLCSCSTETESVSHLFLFCHFFDDLRDTLKSNYTCNLR